MELTTKYGARVEVRPVYWSGRVVGYVGQLDECNWVAFSLKGTHIESSWVHSIRPNANTAVIEHYRRQQRAKVARSSPRTRRPRDAQRRKVYAAEDLAFRRPPEGFEPFPRDTGRTLDKAVRYANHVAARVGRAGQVPPFKLNRRRGAFHRVWFSTGLGAPSVIRSQIDFSREAIELDWVIVHELCHEWSDFFSVAGHGREWCALYLATVREVLGERWYVRLKGAFDVLGVKYRAPRAKRQLTDEQRANLRERLAKARAAKQAKENS